MIPKLTSHELNNMLNNSNEKLNTIINDIRYAKSDIAKKYKIMRVESEYIESQIETLRKTFKETNTSDTNGMQESIFVYHDRDLSKYYDSYGCTVTPAFKGSPINTFNILATATGEAFYRDIAEVSINGVVREEFKGILKHDSIKSKVLYFDEIEGDNPSVTISINLDASKIFGTTIFNMIEFDSFLNGSYTIDSIKIYTGESVTEFTGYEDAGKMRIVLDKEYSFDKVEMKITPHYYETESGVKKYYIGIKHLYFYNCKFVTNGYIVSEITSRDYIDSIEDKVVINTPNGKIESTATNEKIEFYLNKLYDSNTGETTLTSRHYPSTSGDIKPIALNVKTIYAKIPLSAISVIGHTFTIATKLF